MKLNNNDLQSSSKLPDRWTVTTLGTALPLTYGKALKKDIRDESGKVPVYGSSGQVGIHSTALTKKPALIVGRKGSVGEVYRSAIPCWPIDTVYFSEQREDSDLKFFEYLLKGLKLNRLDKSTAVPGLSRDDYNAVEVAIAPLDQQKKIVAEIEKQFSRLDEAVANLKRVKANLKRYKAAVLKAAVEGRLVETEAELARREGRGYETGAQLLQRILETRRSQWKGKGKYKDPAELDTTDLPELPEGWVWSSVDRLVAHLTDGDHQPPPQKEQGIPFLVIGNVRDGEIDFSDTRFVGDDYYKALESNRRPQKDDLLYTLVGSYGIPVRVKTESPFCVQRHMAILRPHADSPMDYLTIAMAADGVFKQATAVATGTAQKTVPLAGLRRIAISLPPFAEQNRIVAEVGRRLSMLRVTETQVDANLQRAGRLRQSVLADAFSGKLSRQLVTLGAVA